jgi:hypothetical protein
MWSTYRETWLLYYVLILCSWCKEHVWISQFLFIAIMFCFWGPHSFVPSKRHVDSFAGSESTGARSWSLIFIWCILDTVERGQFEIQLTKKRKVFWIMKNLYLLLIFLKLANSLLKELVLLLSVRYAVTCDAFTLTNYKFTWCSEVISIIFNSCFGSISCYVGKFHFEDLFLNCHFKLFGDNCMKIIITGHIFLLNYELSRFSK